MPPSWSAPGIRVAEHELGVPLDHGQPAGEQLTLFAREVAAVDGTDRPYLVFLQGGPGHEAPRVSSRDGGPAWLGRALEDFRVLLVDQRGTGRSSPLAWHAQEGATAHEQADRLALFRADAIVRDCELLREALGVERWSVLGQSFGGFCVVTYLSLAPDGLREALITGGLPPVGGRDVDDVYAATYRLVAARHQAYFERFAGDRERYARLLGHLREHDVRLPSGDRLTDRRMRQAGGALGMSDGAAALHHLLERDPRSPAFLHDAEEATSYARNPLYAHLQEACWADGVPTRWSAARLHPDAPRDLLLAEHVLPWMYEDHGALAPHREAIELLHERRWPRLHDVDVLRRNAVPTAAAVWIDDLYVPRELSEETAATIRGCRPWITNEHDHDGVRAAGPAVLGRLLDLTRGRA